MAAICMDLEAPIQLALMGRPAAQSGLRSQGQPQRPGAAGLLILGFPCVLSRCPAAGLRPEAGHPLPGAAGCRFTLPLSILHPSSAPQLGYALKQGIPFLVLFGESEVEAGVVKIKDLDANTEETVPEVS